eukprot:CAMPEP_0197918126 /NCGR_PEP_ID=MMETSP1439-20131203/84914_1 /TAXON_ID=66791 /ORGANISM="Gonyaulax spinifera, Strain CCMP409" /LENGTH=44 /DNA_ID= /DNA_START= /DNA_END= /DNA_ORIENTATION=
MARADAVSTCAISCSAFVVAEMASLTSVAFARASDVALRANNLA